MSIKLSICIPTYNRAAFLGEALDSVIRQATDEVEIVVSDNASTDNTEALVREYQARFPRIRYHKNPENLGADRNFLKVVELGEGEYCWLLGSDDALAEGAIAAMLPLLGDADVYLMDRTNMSFAMDQTLVAHERFLGAPPGTTYDCRNAVELRNYFRDALHIGSFFSYISAIVVRRSAWQAQPVIDELIGSAWIHAARIFQMMQAGARVHYIGRPLVLNRTGNDSFHAAVGFTRRRLIDLDYPRVARTVFVDRPELANEVTQIVARQLLQFARHAFPQAHRDRSRRPSRRPAARRDLSTGIQPPARVPHQDGSLECTAHDGVGGNEVFVQANSDAAQCRRGERQFNRDRKMLRRGDEGSRRQR